MKQYDGQMNIFDFIGNSAQLEDSGWLDETMNHPVENKVSCALADDCDAYPVGCGGTINPCTFGGPFRWKERLVYTGKIIGNSAEAIIVCNYSNHSCNKKELWKVAEMDNMIKCPRMCCRSCNEKMCGARCNGA